jgi:hypothetical protein
MLEIYTKRLTAVDEEEAFMDAQKALKENKFFRRIFGSKKNE